MQSDSVSPDGKKTTLSSWKEIVAKYQKPATGRGVWQVANTVIPYFALWYAMFLCLRVSYWLVLPLAVLAGGFTVRMFILFHDCGHGSFFKSQKANAILGSILGLFTWTPFHYWRWEHSVHHRTAQDLDRRGTGDIWTLTVQEYLEASRWRKFSYRLARNPIILFGAAPVFIFMIKYRFALGKVGKEERLSVYLTNLGLLAIGCGLSAIFELKEYLLIQFVILLVGGATGIWLFYVQHQFEGVYWERCDDWDYESAALKGSSFYKLPKVLQWFSGNIGFHHIHHLSPRIPNYNLEKCHKSEPLFQKVKPITFFSSFKSFTFRLWDEQRGQLVGFSVLRKFRSKTGTRFPV